MALRSVSLDDKYVLDSGRVFITGIQALVRLPMLQKARDRAVGLNTAGLVTGYRGSPLGALDQQMLRAESFLKSHDVVFQPAVNEELAATACAGSQQINLHGQGRYDGVFAMWYGKGPGVDRSGDALRHGNLFGSAAHGGVLALMGDDHACESSTTANQSEFAMIDAMLPILNPAGVQDILDFGLYGYALSRFSGAWVGLKCVHDTVEATASVDISNDRTRVVIPDDGDIPEDGLNIRYPDPPLDQEYRLHTYKLEAAKAFVRANAIDRVVIDSPRAWLGVATTGKSYLDVRQALLELGIDNTTASDLGIRVYKLGVSWPIEPQGLAAFCAGLESVVVVEEKRGVIEPQVKSLLYGRSDSPQVIGKRDEQGQRLFHSVARLNATDIAIALGKRIVAKTGNETVQARLRELESRVARNQQRAAPAMVRTPYFCAGCPHNTSTRIPEGSDALAGIGCHFMAQWMDRSTDGYTQMGGEGASWIGEAPFSQRRHIFQNMGDGTYYHSGLLALRAAVAANVNMTLKVLYNDAVAMTGGQPMDGPLTVPRITQQAYAEGVKQIAVVTDEPEKYADDTEWAPGVSIHHRDELDTVQRQLREVAGVTVLVYDQTCASEKRRRRKRGAFPDPAKRVFINEEVCEGCGDCGVQSNCVAILPAMSALGRKRRIDQSACNKDYSCVKGFCPSFVTVHGGQLMRGAKSSQRAPERREFDRELPDVDISPLQDNYGIVLTGVGGTGVVTVGAVIGMAAHIAHMGCSILDMAGLAQKGGSVTSHIILAPTAEDITTTHVAAGGADLMLGCDIVTTAANTALDKARHDHTLAVVNTFEMMTGDFTADRDKRFPLEQLKALISDTVGNENTVYVNATRLAERLLGNTIGANFFMLGLAWQKGAVPLPLEAITRAIELNGQAVEMNLEAFTWGRRAAVDVAQVETLAAPVVEVSKPAAVALPKTASQIIEHRAALLTDYQDAAYAERYRKFVERVRQAESRTVPGSNTLTETVARYYYRLLAYKDEYEVARLYSDGRFMAALGREFDGDYKLTFHLAPPLFARVDKTTGRPKKREYGHWMLKVFALLARLRGLRGTRWDVFGYSEERQAERRMIVDYEEAVAAVLRRLDHDNHDLACEIAALPEEVRGYGPVKQAATEQYNDQLKAKLSAYSMMSEASAAA